MRRIFIGLVLVLLLPPGALAEIELFPDNELLVATQAGDLDAVDALLIRGGNPNSADRTGKTALIYAAMAGNEDMIEVVMRHRAKVDQRDRNGNTALFYAATRGKLQAA